MNKCFLLGKVIGKIDFKFAVGERHSSVVRFYMQLENKSIVKLITYDNLADYCYRNIKTNNELIVYGKLENNMEIYITEIYLFKEDI